MNIDEQAKAILDKHEPQDADGQNGHTEASIIAAMKEFLYKHNTVQQTIEDVITYIEHDAEILIPVERFFDDDGNHITQKHYGNILLEILCKELREHYLKDVVDICLEEGCYAVAQKQYRLCPKHLREAHERGFDDSNK